MVGRLHGTLVLVVPALVLALGLQPSIGFAQTDPVAVLRQAVDARNRGDLAGTMAVFADDAVRQDGTCPTGCVGAAAVRASMEQSIAEHLQATLLTAQTLGDTVTARAELRSDTFRAGGAERVLSNFTVEFRGGQIVRWSSTLDSSDAQTAAYVAYQAALQAQTGQTGPTAPAPAAPPSLQLPRTGQRKGAPLLATLVVAALATGLGVLHVARRRR